MKSSIFHLLAISIISVSPIWSQHTLIDVPASANSGEALRIDNSVGIHRPYMSFYSQGTYRGFLQAGTTAFEIGTQNAFPLIFSLNGAEMMRMHNNGFVGIGTNAPTTGRLMVSTPSNAIHGIHAISTNLDGNDFVAAIRGQNNATNGVGYGVYGTHAGTGTGVYGQSNTGTGVYGFAPTGYGVWGQSTNFVGILGLTSSSTAAAIAAINLAANTAPNATSKVLTLDNGMLAVAGAHRRTAFQIDVPAATSAVHVNYYGATDATDYRGQSATDILIITPVTNHSLFPNTVVIWQTDHWVIFSSTDDGSTLNFPVGTKFNVLVIKTP